MCGPVHDACISPSNITSTVTLNTSCGGKGLTRLGGFLRAVDGVEVEGAGAVGFVGGAQQGRHAWEAAEQRGKLCEAAGTRVAASVAYPL